MLRVFTSDLWLQAIVCVISVDFTHPLFRHHRALLDCHPQPNSLVEWFQSEPSRHLSEITCPALVGLRTYPGYSFSLYTTPASLMFCNIPLLPGSLASPCPLNSPAGPRFPKHHCVSSSALPDSLHSCICVSWLTLFTSWSSLYIYIYIVKLFSSSRLDQNPDLVCLHLWQYLIEFGLNSNLGPWHPNLHYSSSHGIVHEKLFGYDSPSCTLQPPMAPPAYMVPVGFTANFSSQHSLEYSLNGAKSVISNQLKGISSSMEALEIELHHLLWLLLCPWAEEGSPVGLLKTLFVCQYALSWLLLDLPQTTVWELHVVWRDDCHKYMLLYALPSHV